MASDIWLRTILIVRKETSCRHIGYSFRLAAKVLLYAPSHRQDITYHGLCYISRRSLAGTRNSSDHWLEREIAQWVHPMKDQSDDPSLTTQLNLAPPTDDPAHRWAMTCCQFSWETRSKSRLLSGICLNFSVHWVFFYYSGIGDI